MENQMLCEYPGGWMLTDDSCKQYVRRYGPRAYQLIEYSMVSQDGPLYEVYVDDICLANYENFEIEDIIKGFGYASMAALYEQYPCRDEANQVVAECIFEHFGSFSAVPLCESVSEALAEKTIHDYLLLHHDIPEFQMVVEVSVEELVCKMLSLQVGETLNFSEYEDGDVYGVVRVKHFDVEMLLINYYGGCSPLVIELNEGDEADKLKAQVMSCMKDYCEACGIERLHMSLEAKADALCPEAEEMRRRKKEALISKDALLEQLSEGGYTDRALTQIRDKYMEVLGFDPIWRYPFCHDGGLGAVLIPVKEGYLWLPYSIIDIDDNEIYEPESASLLDAESCELLIEEMTRYVDPLTSVMRYVADELRETEKLSVGGKYGGICSVCQHPYCVA